jgi:hypothetical protein
VSNIEREECPVHGIDYGVTTTIGADRWCQHCGRPANRLVMVEYVSADQLRAAVDALYSAHDFIGRVTKWTGADEDERDGLLAEIEKHLPAGGGRDAP